MRSLVFFAVFAEAPQGCSAEKRINGMIICRTPYRLSFFGGGTDYPGWYRSHGGAVLATTIDKYCYLTCRFLPPFLLEEKHVDKGIRVLTKLLGKKKAAAG